MVDIREHMMKDHNTPEPIVKALTEEQLEDWDDDIHADIHDGGVN